MNELKLRGVNDILIAVVDGLKGFPEAITTVFPQTLVQTCIVHVHLIRNSLAFVTWKDRKTIMPSIRAVYQAENADMALIRLEEFEAEWGKRYPAIGQAWRRAWEHVVPFFAFAPAIRKMIYTTNCVEALNRSLRKIIKTRASFPTDEAAFKLLYLAIKNAGVHWRRPIEWTAAMGQFAIQFGEPFCFFSALKKQNNKRKQHRTETAYTKLRTLPRSAPLQDRGPRPHEPDPAFR
jgi:putative transposase